MTAAGRVFQERRTTCGRSRESAFMDPEDSGHPDEGVPGRGGGRNPACGNRLRWRPNQCTGISSQAAFKSGPETVTVITASLATEIGKVALPVSSVTCTP